VRRQESGARSNVLELVLVLVLDWARLAKKKELTEGRKDLKESD
jgi:hypothetical protein